MVRPREFDDEDVLGRVMQVFWERGYSATSIQDLEEATGLGRGSLYGAFGGKQELFLRGLTAYGLSGEASMRQRFDGVPDPVEAVRGLIRDIAAHAACAAGANGCFLGNTVAELAMRDADIRAKLGQFFEVSEGVLAAALQRGVSLGLLAPDKDPAAVAAFLVCAMQGLALRGKAGLSEAKSAAICREILSVLERP